MIRIFDTETNQPLGEVSEEDLQFLVDQLEEETRDDRDYYLNRTLLDTFAEAGAPPKLLELLRQAMGGREEMEIRWERS